MARYVVYYQASVTSSVEVEAEDEAEAMDKADQEFEGGGLCHYCSTHCGDLSDWFPVEGDWGIEKLCD